MLVLPTHDVKVGMKLAMSVMNPRKREQELLRAGFALDKAIIERLKSLDVTHVFVEFEGLDDLDALLMPLLSPERQAIYQTVKATIARSQQQDNPVVKYS
ncbi:MAG TPA: hypothetical protein VGB55_00005, partial [Tepidisphaeraceae bacterium]